jgi:hypothetical protein
VDQYCIDQHDTIEKHEQIGRMNLTYEASQLMIIAAAGDGEDSGLPGIGSTGAPPQLVACFFFFFRKITVIST